jgi:hypothetical protein
MRNVTIEGQLCPLTLRPNAAATLQRTRLRSLRLFELNTSHRHQRGAAAA